MATTTDTQWEHKVTTVGTWRGTNDEQLEAALNELGQAGWEVITVSPNYTSGKVLVVARRAFNRRRRQPRIKESWANG
jgi:hypothetical protein